MPGFSPFFRRSPDDIYNVAEGVVNDKEVLRRIAIVFSE